MGGGQDPHLQATWFFNDVETAHVDAGGVLDLKKDYQERSEVMASPGFKVKPQVFLSSRSSLWAQRMKVHTDVQWVEGNKSPDGSCRCCRTNSRQTALCTLKQAGMWSWGQTWLGLHFNAPPLWVLDTFMDTVGEVSWSQYQSGHFEVEWNKGKHPN